MQVCTIGKWTKLKGKIVNRLTHWSYPRPALVWKVLTVLSKQKTGVNMLIKIWIVSLGNRNL